MHKQWVILRVLIASMVVLGLLLAACQVTPTPVPTPAGPAAAPTSPPPKAVQVIPTTIPTPGAPTAAPTSPPSKPVGELVLAVDNFGGEHLWPPLGVGAAKIHLSVMYDDLVGMDIKGSALDPTTGVAKRWEVSPDGLTWTFWLREGIKFHNGEDLTAEDVKFSIERNTGKKSLTSNAATIGKRIASIDIQDPYRLTIRLTIADWTFPTWLSPMQGSEGMIYPKKYVTEKGEDYVADHPVGSGPYRLEKWVSGNYITYKAVGNWLVRAPKYDKITFKLVPEESSRIAMLETGQAQIINAVSPAKKAQLEGKFNLFPKEGSNIAVLQFHKQFIKNNPLGNEKVREALALALNKKEMFDHILNGEGSLSENWLAARWSPAYEPLEPTPFDPERAKRLLKEAGYGPGELKVNIYIYTRPGFGEMQKLSSEAAAGYWEKIGVKVNLITMDFAVFRSKQKNNTLDNPAIVVGHPMGARYVPPLELFFHSTNPDIMVVEDPNLDALLDAMVAAPDEKSYTPAARKVVRYIKERFLALTLYEVGAQLATTKDISEWELGQGRFKDFNLGYLYRR